jgi:glycosyltransferase involved in cell wall biosynthesis
VIHAHCEEYFTLIDQTSARVKIVSSHAPPFYEHAQRDRVIAFLNDIPKDYYICCLSDRTRQYICDFGIHATRLFVAINGSRSDLHRFTENARYPDRSICLATVSSRKRQSLIQGISFIDFVGPTSDSAVDCSRINYLGEWTKEDVYFNLTNYAALALLSRSEVAPLAICEALMSGLGLVISESAAANLDLSMPFIHVIPEQHVTNVQYVLERIKETQRIAVAMRHEIRYYAVAHFDWQVLVRRYIHHLEQFLENATST